jgi:hypothetical protein
LAAVFRFPERSTTNLPTIQAIEPTYATAGDTWQWQRSFDDFLISDGWALSYGINGPKHVVWNPAWVTNDGSIFTVTIPPATTTALTLGTYELIAILTGSGSYAGQRVSIKLPPIIVLPDPALAVDGSRVSHAATVLPIIEAALSGRLSADMQRYMIAGREVTKIPIAELRQLRAQYRRELWRENHPTRSAPMRKVIFRVS